MSIISFIVVVTLIGVLLWAVNKFLPIEAGIKKFLNIAVVVLLILWLVYIVFGNSANIGDIKIPRIR